MCRTVYSLRKSGNFDGGLLACKPQLPTSTRRHLLRMRHTVNVMQVTFDMFGRDMNCRKTRW